MVLRDTIPDTAFRTYRLLPFEVPEGVKAVEIRFDYTGRDARTTIDVGLLGPGETFDAEFRGWSGGNKRSFILSSSDATPSYLASPVQPGRWQLLLGVPNIRKGQTSEFTAQVYFQRNDAHGLPTQPEPLRAEAGWYRGDLHMHSSHSDGSCASKSGTRRVPCPLFLTLDAAAERGLDFVAVTEHNTNSHVKELTALQPYFDRTLLIPGMEMTTFQGHANAFNLREPLDFRVGSQQVPDWNSLLTRAKAKGALVSINHPRVPTGEACMGCGWSPQPAADLSLVQAVEVVNGYDVDSPTAGIPFWHEQLQKGHRLTAIGGSDTHDIKSRRAATVGVPTTVVYARELSVDGIVEGIRAGNVFIDTAGTRDRKLEMTARHGQSTVSMGGELRLPLNQPATFTVRVEQIPDGSIEVIRDGAIAQRSPIPAATHSWSFEETSDGKSHWIRIDVRDADGKLALIGNPIYLR
ncbi:CehA/McbA family metallohydrolase [Steroidobacter sp. S1-65]|uniref:CehA/McbA family metallohydrolase n=1 Tax=Steroidobacter gossypii TaxID=2805490 RepID=A0ABS1X3C9_9GAMM|nr:CehA/McbA family metallohydrolase [Steroidobacter gossypii]MBM0107734.1 CehA/McbA family metallohydrolase [Steroidobacter gossypii]